MASDFLKHSMISENHVPEFAYSIRLRDTRVTEFLRLCMKSENHILEFANSIRWRDTRVSEFLRHYIH